MTPAQQRVTTPSYKEFFTKITAHDQAHTWQHNLANETTCYNRLIRIPTGFGKTQGILAAWLWNRVFLNNETWPRRIIWCLPMRVLVEQTEAEVKKALNALNALWSGGDHTGKVGLHLLMGGANAEDWHLYPEECAVLIGTQDMLLSRAMNRGYGAARARWPMDFGLLNQDSLWVMDEVQLMDVGLATSGQLQAFRGQDTSKFLRPCHTWWMSATLQHEWLRKSPETIGLAAVLPHTEIEAKQRTGHLWDDVEKPVSLATIQSEKELAAIIAEKHCEKNERGLTLVVVNTVERAIMVYEALETLRKGKNSKNLSLHNVDLRLIHSRFRPAERIAWRDEFLNPEACAAGIDRIIIATQVIEAGVDLSATLLITELAPWASLVQRFGRCARWGGHATVLVADFQHKDERKAAPYSLTELDAARQALAQLPQPSNVSPRFLEEFEERSPELLPHLYPYEPQHLLLRHELDDLFDTSPDLSGADVDISRFIRTGEERDLHVFWAEIQETNEPDSDLRPCREALCAIPFLKARDWLCGKETSTKKAPRLLAKMRAWVWDFLDSRWQKAQRHDLYPGQTVLIASSCGGYSPSSGWKSDAKTPVAPVETSLLSLDISGDSGQDDESSSLLAQWRTIATHGQEAADLASHIVTALAPEFRAVYHLAGRWHDIGKAFPAFQLSIKTENNRPQRQDIAKAPQENWLRGKQLYPMPDGSHRPGFRHELASTLALFSIVQAHAPEHPALLGPWHQHLSANNALPPFHPQTNTTATTAGSLEQEILALSACQFNLVAFLLCSHHGKMGIAWHASPADQQITDAIPRIRGIRDGDELPSIPIMGGDGAIHTLSPLRLNLSPANAGLSPQTGPSWTERALGLLRQHGPFTLAWLIALFRAADQRASQNAATSLTPDPLLEKGHDRDSAPAMERNNSCLETTIRREETCDPLAEDSSQCCPEHGLRTGTCGSGNAGSHTCPPAHATRHIPTQCGLLNYIELAPLLAKRVQGVEEGIESGAYDMTPLNETLFTNLHAHICQGLTPQLCGWRCHNVRVGQHTPPPFYEISILMREYSRDLETRLTVLGHTITDQLLETLAFAEGRLLSIHPFADFNGRVTRVFLRLLLRKLDLPAVDLVPTAEEWLTYLSALRAADILDWRPLILIWQHRFVRGAHS